MTATRILPAASLMAASLMAASLMAASLVAAGFPAAAQAPAPSAATPAEAVATLAGALATIRSRRKVDLTHAFGPATSSGFGRVRVTPAVDPRSLEALTIARDGRRASYYAFPGPTGTAVEAPAAVSADGATLDSLPVDEMLLPLVVLDDTPFLAADPAHAFSPDDLAAFERAHGRVPAGSFVALRTDLAKDWGTPRFARRPFPAFTATVLKLLVEERGVAAVGQESLSPTVDREGAAYVLGRGRWVAGGLDHLDALPATGAAILAAWPKPAGGFAFPARIVAILP